MNVILVQVRFRLNPNYCCRNSFLLLYLGAMHLLVFFTIYYNAHHVHNGCDPSLDHLSPAETAAIAAALHHS